MIKKHSNRKMVQHWVAEETATCRNNGRIEMQRMAYSGKVSVCMICVFPVITLYNCSVNWSVVDSNHCS